jgi:hypothetical protein
MTTASFFWSIPTTTIGGPGPPGLLAGTSGSRMLPSLLICVHLWKEQMR